MSTPVFRGTSEQQELAKEIFQIMKMQGSFFAADAPIRQSLKNLSDYLATTRKTDQQHIAQEIDAALRENSMVFYRVEDDDEVFYITSRTGTYQPTHEESRHSFRQRFYEPENPLPVDDVSVVFSTSRPVLTSVEPVLISDYWQEQAEFAVPVERPLPETDEGTAGEPAEDLDAVRLAGEDGDAETASAEGETDAAEAAPEGAAAAAGQEGEAEQAEPVEVIDPKFALTMPNGTQIDLSKPTPDLLQRHGDLLRRTIIEQLEEDPLRRIVSFGRCFYPEAGIVSMGKNDLRRIRDYIMEVGEPLLDTAIIADLYYHNPRQGDYEGFRFSLNYRLSREKDFEFVGVEGARLWSTKGLTITKTKRVKISEMGQLANFLTEPYDDSLEGQSVDYIKEAGMVNRLLTFFEWEYGILPLDQSLEALLPAPMLAEQRSAVLRIEAPQHYMNFLVELRYPAGNRGGWLQGFESFFHEHLVAGALITLTRTEEPHVFTITYEEITPTSERLLTLDEKKNKFAFSTMEFYCAVDEDQIISQQRFGKLKNLKSLPMGERRKADVVLKHIFEVFGDQIGSRDEPYYRLNIQDLHRAYNVLRPASVSYLRVIIDEEEEFTVDELDADTCFYKPEPEPVEEEADDEELEDEGYIVGGRRWSYGDDDE
jgi:hypothetical protein